MTTITRSRALTCALLLSPLAACDGGGGKGDDSGSPDTDLHECAPVTPVSEEGIVRGTITAEESIVEETWTAPADRATGVLIASHAPPAEDGHTAALSLIHDPSVYGEGMFEETPGELLEVAGAITPGDPLRILYERFASAADAVVPYDIEVPWTWVETDDCYEPNDQFSEARHVPTGEVLEAWMISGLGDDPSVPDWYRFTLAEPSTVTISWTGPDTIAPALTIYAAGAVETDFPLDGVVGEAGNVAWSSAGTMEAGTYVFWVEPFVSLGEIDFPQDPIMSHMWETYTFEVQAAPAE